MKESKKVFITGLRPTAADLHLGNYLGVLVDILAIQEKWPFYLFVADLHAMTTHSPRLAAANSEKIILDYLAAGIEPEKCVFYRQSALAGETFILEMLLSRHFSVAQAMRVPTLKEKVRHPRQASLFLLRYPTLMAADILLQRANRVPVGEDQLAHLEISRQLALKFNKQYGQVFPIPQPFRRQAVKLASLDGEGKMSKSRPKGAIFLSDNPATVATKIKRAKTETLSGPRRTMSPTVASLFLLAEKLGPRRQEKADLATMRQEYFRGRLRFVHLKELTIKIVNRFLADFQARRQYWQAHPHRWREIVRLGNQRARQRAQATLAMVSQATGFDFRASFP